jgi:hypothetical protein
MMITPGALGRFQDDFAHALLAVDEAAPPAVAALAGQPAFAVYRNTVVKACIDALQANYPAVNRLVGDEWMRAAAAVYARKTLPGVPMLLEYGADFADFLAGFEPAAELPYLPGVARLDRCWTEAHIAATEDPLDAAAIAQLAEGNFYRLRLQPHAAARWAWCADAPAYTIWSRNRSDAQDDTEIEWHGEGALLSRPRGVVTWRALDRAGCVFLDACAAGSTVAAATQAALDIDSAADLSQLIATLLDAGAFSRIRIDNRQNPFK